MRIPLHTIIAKIWQKHKDESLIIFLQKSRKNKVNVYFMQKMNLSANYKGIKKKWSQETPLRDLKSKQLLPTRTNKKHAPIYSDIPLNLSHRLNIPLDQSHNNLNTQIRTSHMLQSLQDHNNHYINPKIHHTHLMHS